MRNIKYIIGLLFISSVVWTASYNVPDLLIIPKATGSRPTGGQGQLFTDSTTNRLQYKDNSAWYNLLGPATTDTLTNKTFDADGTGNSISNIENADIKSGAAIARDKLASGTADHVLINNGSGVMSSEALLSQTRGGTGVNNAGTLTYGSNNIIFTTTGATGVTIPTTGVLSTLDGAETLTSKTITAPIIDGPNITYLTATNNIRLILPNETTANLDALTDVAGYLAYDTTQEAVVFNNGTAWTAVGTGNQGPYAGGVNLIINNSWEGSDSNWTASGGTYARNTTVAHIIPPGIGSASWDPSASAQTLTANTVTITSNDGLSGRNGVMSCAVKTAATDLKMQAYDGTNVISPNGTTDVVPSSSAGFVRYSVNFIFPSSGTITGRFYAQSDSAIAYIDDCYLGLAENQNVYNISQAEFYGGLKYPQATNCAWNTTSSSFANFSADSDCTTPTGSNLYGKGTAPATKVPGVTFTSLPPGEYVVRAIGRFEKSNTNNMSCGWRFHDGTTAAQAQLTASNAAYYSVPVIEGRFVYTTTQGSTTIQIQANSSDNISGCNVDAANNTGNDGLQILVYRFPTANQTAYKPDEISWYVDANISGANIDLGTSTDFSSYTEMTNASLTLTNNSGSATAQIACASGTASTGTTCSVSESNGIAFTIPKAGSYKACVEFGHFKNTAATGQIKDTFQIVETTNTSSAVVQEGKSRVPSYLQTASTLFTNPVNVCGVFVFSSAGQKTLRLEYEQDVTATNSFNYVLADADATVGQQDIHWTVRPWLNNEPAPLLVNTVVSPSTGIEHIARAQINCDGSSAITSQSGSWITAVGNINGSGGCALTIASGTFTSAPSCVTTKLTCSAGGGTDCFTMGAGPATTTAFTTKCYSDSGSACTANDFDIICMGAK